MSEKEMRELDAWIAEHVMEWQWWRFKIGKQQWCQLVPPDERWPKTKTDWNGIRCGCAIALMEDCTDLSMFRPTTDPAASFAVLERCAQKVVGAIQIIGYETTEAWVVQCDTGDHEVSAEAKTLPLAISEFAKALFSK